jgi:hypothetical protein
MLYELPPALAGGFIQQKTSGFSQIQDKKSLILTALAKKPFENSRGVVTPASCRLSGGHLARHFCLKLCNYSLNGGTDAALDSRQDGGVTIFSSFQTASKALRNNFNVYCSAKACIFINQSTS